MDDRVWQETAVPPVFGKEIETRIVKPTSNAGVGFFLSQSTVVFHPASTIQYRKASLVLLV
jgi:hypothetical protein